MSDEMAVLTARTQKIIDSLTNAILSSAEVAAEKIELATRVAQAQNRMAAFGAILDAVGAQKLALMERREAAEGPMKVLLGHQIDMLGQQELAILKGIGVDDGTAAKALESADDEQLYRRRGRSFQPLNGHKETT